jgi:GAF domain-containing protein
MSVTSGPKHIERRAVAEPALQLHVVLDLVERHVPRAFDHDLHAVAPGALGQLAERLELGELRVVGRVGQTAGAQAVADRERDIVLAHDLADVVPHGRT